MNKTIIININSIVFHIEEDAYETLRSYMIEIKRHFGKSEDSREILEDIENRIAEMFSERIQSGRKEVINSVDVNEVISQMGRVSDFETELDDEVRGQERPEAQAFSGQSATTSAEEFVEEDSAASENNEPSFINYPTSKKLMRDMDDRVFGGVCSGLGHYFNIDSKWVRIIFVLFFLFGGSGVLLYFVLWAVMPKALTRADRLAMRGEEANLQNFKKSFDEEMKGIRENFSGTGEHINRGARSVGDLFGRLFSIFGKILAVIALIIAGSTIIGMFIFLVFNILNIMGYENPIYFPPLEMLNPTSAFFAILAGCLAIGIPFLALFFAMLRVLFKARPLNNYGNMTMLAVWIVSIVMILYFVIVTNQEFREESTISVEKPLEKQNEYTFLENDVRIIKTTGENFDKKKYDLTIDGERIGDFLRRDISISFESIDSLKAPYIQYNYMAKGNTYGEASERASKIRYQVKQAGENVVFDSHFSLLQKQLQRDQRVFMVVYLPVGTKVKLHDDLEGKVRDAWLYDCKKDESAKVSEWIMTAQGLKCVKKLEEDRLKHEEEAKEAAEEAAEKAKEEAKENKKEDKSKDDATNEEAESSSDEDNA